jgi:hypothetical protein
MYEWIKILISTIISAIIALWISWFGPSWKRNIIEAMPQKKRSIVRMKILFKYFFFLLAIVSIIVFIPFGSWFVISLSGLVLIISFFISYDFYNYLLQRIDIMLSETELEKEHDRILNELTARNILLTDEQEKQRRHRLAEIDELLRKFY